MRPWALLCILLLAGCAGIGTSVDADRTYKISMWVEEMDWEIAPGVTTKVWAFCATGDGVEAPLGPCSVPGPTIRVRAGDTVELTFTNDHTIPHTVHFHGRHGFQADQTGNHLLGDAFVVDPGESETIRWVADPAGTFIYHCHFDTPTHMEMGMSGAFIVEDRYADKPDVEHVAVLDEWALGDLPAHGNMPAYDYFTISGKSFPLTEPILANVGDRVRIHMVNAGYEFHAMHLHGYVPDAWEGVAGPAHAVPTDVREIAPGQSVVLDFLADREGVWLFHDHVVPRVTAGTDGNSFGAYPRGMLTVLAVGQASTDALLAIAPTLLEAANGDPGPHTSSGTPADDHEDHAPGSTAPPAPAAVTSDMEDFVFKDGRLEIAAGTTVTWVNRDGVAHTVTDAHGSFDSGNIGGGQRWSHAFDTPGEFTIYCKPHAYKQDGEWKGMVATVVVS